MSTTLRRNGSGSVYDEGLGSGSNDGGAGMRNPGGQNQQQQYNDGGQ